MPILDLITTIQETQLKSDLFSKLFRTHLAPIKKESELTWIFTYYKKAC